MPELESTGAVFGNYILVLLGLHHFLEERQMYLRKFLSDLRVGLLTVILILAFGFTIKAYSGEAKLGVQTLELSGKLRFKESDPFFDINTVGVELRLDAKATNTRVGCGHDEAPFHFLGFPLWGASKDIKTEYYPANISAPTRIGDFLEYNYFVHLEVDRAYLAKSYCQRSVVSYKLIFHGYGEKTYTINESANLRFGLIGVTLGEVENPVYSNTRDSVFKLSELKEIKCAVVPYGDRDLDMDCLAMPDKKDARLGYFIDISQLKGEVIRENINAQFGDNNRSE